MNNFYGMKYFQAEQAYISMICPMQFVIKNSEVLIYGQDLKYGYQRAPRKDHYLKIAKRLLDNEGLVTPNSIILGINDDELDYFFEISEVSKNEFTSVLELVPKADVKEEKKFRIIDGQHRISGFKEAIEKSVGENKNKLENYNANVIIMLLNKKYRLPEVKVFSDINSKAKPLKMDLTLLAEYQYLLLERPNDLNVNNYLITRVLKLLNDGTNCEGWTNAIIFDVNAEKRIGCVGFKTFLNTIEPLCKYFLHLEGSALDKLNYFEEKQQLLNKIAQRIYEELAACWNCVFQKWPAIEKKWVSDNEENQSVYYSQDFYLQRTMGVVAINKIITKCYLDGKGFEEFKDVIINSPLMLEDWKVNSKFAGLNSMSGAKKIEKEIYGAG